jgi:hypothetical protein
VRALLLLLGIILIVVAIAYLLIPADALPTWMPGYEAGRTATRMKHGLAAGGVGILLLILGWFMGRR